MDGWNNTNMIISSVVSSSCLIIIFVFIYFVFFTKVDCEVDKRSDWSECDKDCGGGSQIRKRKIIKEAKNGGKECGKLKETKECNTQKCSVDCKLGEWGEWSKCDKECGGG